MLSLTNSFFSNTSLVSFFDTQLCTTHKWNALAAELTTITPVLTNSTEALFAPVSLSVFVLNVFFLLGALIVFYASVYGVRIFKHISSGFDINFVLFSYLSDLEEVGAADDALFFFLIIGSAIVWFFFFTVFSAAFLTHLSWVLSLLVLSMVAAIVIPAAVLKNFGIAFVAYVRGHGSSTSLFYEGVLDLVSVSIIFLRFLVQNMRFIFIFVTMFEVYESIYINFSPLTTAAVTNYTNYYWLEAVTSVIYSYATFLYGVGHSTIIFIAQLSIYFALSFWLFFFLYTTFTLESTEKYFFYKRAL